MILTDPYVEAALGSLRARLDARIAAINAEYGLADDDALDPVGGNLSDGSVDPVRYPWVEVAAPEWRMHSFSLEQWEAALDTTVVVRGWLLDAQQRRLFRKLQLLGRALVESLVIPNAFGGGVVIREVRGSYPINPETDDRAELTGWALLVFTLEGSEGRGDL